MNLRGLTLIGFSVACLGVAGLAYQEQKSQSISRGLASAIGYSGSCAGSSFDTPLGRVSCMQQTSYAFAKETIRNLTGFSGGGAFQSK